MHMHACDERFWRVLFLLIEIHSRLKSGVDFTAFLDLLYRNERLLGFDMDE